MASQTYKLNDGFFPPCRRCLDDSEGWRLLSCRWSATKEPCSCGWFLPSPDATKIREPPRLNIKFAALWTVFSSWLEAGGYPIPSAPSLPNTSHLKRLRHQLDWGELMVCQWRIEAIEAIHFLVFGGLYGFSGLKSRGNEVTLRLRLDGPTENLTSAPFVWPGTATCPARNRGRDLGQPSSRRAKLCFLILWFWLKHSNLKPSEFKIGCVFPLGKTGVLPQVGETWPLGAWACHVASGIWSRALGWRLLRVKL